MQSSRSFSVQRAFLCHGSTANCRSCIVRNLPTCGGAVYSIGLYTPPCGAVLLFPAKAKEENPSLYGDIELMFTAGVDDGDSDKVNYAAAYKEADKWLKAHPGKTINDFAGAVDHHYYNSPDWFRPTQIITMKAIIQEILPK